jgi:hypothetical protein
MVKLTQVELKRYVINEVLAAVQAVSTSAREMPPTEVDTLRCNLAQKFGLKKNYPLNFENMSGKYSVQNEEAWRSISRFLDNSAHYMFYDHSCDHHGIEFYDGKKISDVLERCFGFPFYITDKNNTFVIGMNDHDYLIGVGIAVDWVKTIGEAPEL